jgi:hypothetical protein
MFSTYILALLGNRKWVLARGLEVPVLDLDRTPFELCVT